MPAAAHQESEVWTPSLFPKQQIVFNLGTQQEAGDPHPECATAALLSGGRETTKTIAIGHRLARHVWETPGARAGILHKTTRNVTDGGVLCDLTDIIFPEWIESNIGFDYTTHDGNGVPGFKADGRTRSIFCKIRNAFGGESEIRIIAIEHDCEIEQKLKSSRWSLLWLNELANFKDPRIFTTSYEQLRMFHLKKWQHLWIADTNPAREGEDFWAYKFWYLRDWSVIPFPHDPKAKEEHEKNLAYLKKALVLQEFFLEDNLAFTPQEIAVKKALHAGDPGEYAREVEGRWVKGSGGKNRHFADVFSRQIHVIEENPKDGKLIELAPTTSELFVGWDLGASVNHGVTFLEKRVVNVGGADWTVWIALREIESIGERIKLQDIALMALEFVDTLPGMYKRTLGFRHWADNSAMDTFRTTGEGYDYLEVQAATKGRIMMQGVYKPDGSVETRIALLRRLIREKRFYVSSQCPRIIDMCENAARGTKLSERVMAPYKHIFDSTTYPIFAESAEELQMMTLSPSTGGSNLISVPLLR